MITAGFPTAGALVYAAGVTLIILVPRGLFSAAYRFAIRDEWPERAGLRSLPGASIRCSNGRMGRNASQIRQTAGHRRRCQAPRRCNK